jgi:hypothetical protein
LVLGLSWPGTHAHAFSFKRFTSLISVETGPSFNFLRLQEGTRQTPSTGVTAGVTADINVLSSQWHPHRLSVVLGAWPTFQTTWDLPQTGVRPSLNNPLPNPHVWTRPAVGMMLSGGLRYRWETASNFVPFLEAGAFAAGHKGLGRGPVHFNLGLRAGGGLEYYVVHKVALFGAFYVRGGPLLTPVPNFLPNAEASAEMLSGIRFRAF